ncbi:MAG: exopolysaccharide biosynthesis polyprenyl glycosylphosphotransferase [Solirubrobacterales bacterium]
MALPPHYEPLVEGPWHGSSTTGLNARLERNRRRDTTFRRLLGLADAVAVTIALVASAVVFGEDAITPTLLLAPVLFVAAAKAAGLYDRDQHLLHKTTLEEVPKIFSLATLAALLLYLSLDVLIEGELGQRQVLGTWIALFALMVIFRGLARMAGRHLTEPERCLLFGTTDREQELRDAIELSDASHATVVGLLPVGDYLQLSDAGELPMLPERMLDELEVDRIVLAPGTHDEDVLMFTIREMRQAGVKVSLLPDSSRMAGSSVEFDHLGGITLLGMRGFDISRSSKVIKRAFDLAAACAIVVSLAPAVALIAALIRLESPGPILFRQRRVGRHGEEFQMLKFRSMRRGSETERPNLIHLNRGAAGLFKIPDDPRVTRIGGFLRRANLDELPQMLNVIAGDMSIVGPRPLVPEEDSQIQGRFRRRLAVRPGITGHWQVLGSARVPIEEMVKLDYLYVANWSLWRDIVLIIRTLPLTLRRRGM